MANGVRVGRVTLIGLGPLCRLGWACYVCWVGLVMNGWDGPDMHVGMARYASQG